jgi:hypothetical protein
MANIFISYNHRNEEVTKLLVKDLQELDNIIWFDNKLTGGQAWWDNILERIRKCDVFLFVLSKEGLDSTACKREYRYAASLGKTVLPVLVSDNVSVNLLPADLSVIQYVDFRNHDTTAVLRLARAMGNIPPSKPLPDPLPVLPDIPISYLSKLVTTLESETPIGFAEQSSVFMDLKRNFLDPETSGDARKLLEILRKRKDLLATIAGEIDELMQRKSITPAVTAPEPGTKEKPAPTSNKENSRKKTKSLEEQPGAPATFSLNKVIVGQWSVQITDMLSNSVTATFRFTANGTFSGQIFSLMGVLPVQGQYTVQFQRLILQGTQTMAFMTLPYTADINLVSILPNMLIGNSSAGEKIVMQKQ